MRYYEPPHRSLFSYLLPFLIIIGIGVGAFFGLRDYLFSSIVLEPVSQDALVQISSIEGDNAFIVPWGLEDRRKLGEGYGIHKGDVVSTEKNTRVEAVLFDGSRLRLNEDTVIYFSRLESRRPHHISLNLVQGEVYIDAKKISHEAADFIVISPKMILQADDSAFLVDTFPIERLRVLEGVVNASIFHVIEERKEPLISTVVRIGEEIVLDTETIDSIATGEEYFPKRFDVISSAERDESSLASSGWYVFDSRDNEEDDESNVLEISEVEAEEIILEDELLEESDYGNVSIISPHENAMVGSSVAITGYYDKDRIRVIFVNGKQAVMNEDDEVWEALVTLTARDKELEVISEDLEGQKRLVERRSVKVDAEPPRVPDIIEPDVDENNRAEVYGDSVVITGRAHSDIARITVTADSHPPYQLKKYAPGDDLFYYKASKSIGNLHDGSNVYTIQYFDEHENVSTSTITLLLLEKEYEGMGVFGSDVAVQIIEPSQSPYKTTEPTVLIRGIVLKKVQKIFINDEPVVFNDGDAEFFYEVSLNKGENPLVVTYEDINGDVDTSGVITLILE